MGERIQIACDNHNPLFHWNDNCIKYINKFHKQQHWHSYPLSFPIISWNCPGNFCESSVITLLICFLVHSVQGGGHLPARTSGARILILFPISSHGPRSRAQLSWNSMNLSSFIFSSVIKLLAAHCAPFTTPPIAPPTAPIAPPIRPGLVGFLLFPGNPGLPCPGLGGPGRPGLIGAF